MRRIAFLIVIAGLFAATPAPAQLDPVAKCEAAKIKAAGKKVASDAKCHANAIAKGEEVDSDCLLKAEQKLDLAVSKADDAGGCPGDGFTIEISGDGCIDELIDVVIPQIGSPCIDDTDCIPFICPPYGFPGGYCTLEDCPTPGETAGCPADGVCTAGMGTPNFCADQCDNSDIGTQGSCRVGYVCTAIGPFFAGCLPE